MRENKTLCKLSQQQLVQLSMLFSVLDITCSHQICILLTPTDSGPLQGTLALECVAKILLEGHINHSGPFTTAVLLTNCLQLSSSLLEYSEDEQCTDQQNMLTLLSFVVSLPFLKPASMGTTQGQSVMATQGGTVLSSQSCVSGKCVCLGLNLHVSTQAKSQHEFTPVVFNFCSRDQIDLQDKQTASQEVSFFAPSLSSGQFLK